MVIHDTLQSAGKELPLVSVISPFFNTQDYIAKSIDSVIGQTYPNWELILVDDGSSDESAEIVKDYMAREQRIRLIQIENHGQGYARNLAIETANGKYVIFLDSDDTLEDITLDLAVSRLEKEGSDFVVFDYLYVQKKDQTNYCNHDSFFSKKNLSGKDCLLMLRISPFYTQNKVYNLEFLKKHGIRYGEGYIYEDWEFWVKAVLNAKCVSLIHSPLYRLTINPKSSTRTKVDSDFHAKSYLYAVSKCVEIFNQFSNQQPSDEFERSRYDLLFYFYDKFACYYHNRTPKELRKAFLKGFVDAMSSLVPARDFGECHSLTFFLRYNIFSKKRYAAFKPVFLYSTKYHSIINIKIISIKRKVKKVAARIRNFKAKLTGGGKATKKDSLYRAQLKEPLCSDIILFMGFDYRYTGNSRYLFEELKARNISSMRLYFVADDPLLPDENRIIPESEDFYRLVARSRIIIFESWIPLKWYHRAGSTWIQLWHGTPLKKLMFDSNERQITAKNPHNKNMKYNDIKRWDYLLVDTPNVMSYFRTCFLIPESKMLPLGYPRVDYLINRKDDKEYCTSLKKFYGIPEDKKIVLYMPTWRDYNYKLTDSEKDFDTNYILNLQDLKSLLGEEYEIVYKDHVFLSKPENIDFKNFQNAETQELLLIADYLLTDYSSVMFDALAIDIPVIMYCNDFERNELARGVYEEMWNDLTPLVCHDTNEVCAAIKDEKTDEICNNLKDKYSHRSVHEDMADFVLKLYDA